MSQNSTPKAQAPRTARQEYENSKMNVNVTEYSNALMKETKVQLKALQLKDKRRSRGERKPDCGASSRLSVATGGADVTIVDDFATSSAAGTDG